MQKRSLIERILHRVDEKTRPVLAPLRRRRLNNTDFTIISNNCWGGVCYGYYGLEKLSPTVGMYFFADDYVKFVSDLHRYLSTPMRIITAEESYHAEVLKSKGQLDIPVGIIGDVEVVFLHYKDPVIAKQTWDRRVARVNWDNLIIKFSYMNDCTDEDIIKFSQYVKQYHAKTLCFLPREIHGVHNGIVIPSLPDGQIGDDTFYWNRYIDVEKLINEGHIK